MIIAWTSGTRNLSKHFYMGLGVHIENYSVIFSTNVFPFGATSEIIERGQYFSEILERGQYFSEIIEKGDN
jgi:hypothetical protein